MSAKRKGPYAKLLREPFDDERIDRLTAAVLERQETALDHSASNRSGWKVWQFGVIGAAALLLVVSAVALFTDSNDRSSSRSGPLRLETLEPLAARNSNTGEATQILRLEDHSIIAFEPGTELRTRHNSGDRLELELISGSATFDVEPGGPRQWMIDGDLATVEVIGTLFTVERAPQSITVSVEHGRVAVESSLIVSGRQLLGAGDRLTLVARNAPPVPNAPADGIRPAHGPDADVPQSESDDAGAEPDNDGDVELLQDGNGRLRWRRLAREGDYHGAWEVLGQEGVQRLTREGRTMSELLELADVARRSGHPEDALAPLRLAIERHATDRRAAVAAFSLGRIEADDLGRHARAARAFRRCLDLHPPQALRETAYARLAEAQAAAGNYQAARAAAREYLRRYPNGRHVEQLMRWIEPDR